MAKKNKNSKDKEATVDFEQIEQENWSPFDAQPKDREYTKPNIDPSTLEAEIAEPTFKMPDLDSFSMENDPTGGSPSNSNQSNSQEKSYQKQDDESPKFNQEFHDLSDKDKTVGAEMMADVALDGYSKLGNLLGKVCEINETALEREIADGNINPDIQMPIDQNGNSANIRTWVNEYNKETKEAFETDKEFIDKVKPPLVRVFKKRGVGMTDEQLLAYYFGTDLVQKGATAFALKRNSNMILSEMRAQTEYMRSGGQPKSSSSDQSTPPPKPSPDGDGSPDIQPTPNEPVVDEFSEYEESSAPETTSFEEIEIETDSTFEDAEVPDNMPKLGDEKALKHMDDVAKNS